MFCFWVFVHFKKSKHELWSSWERENTWPMKNVSIFWHFCSFQPAWLVQGDESKCAIIYFFAFNFFSSHLLFAFKLVGARIWEYMCHYLFVCFLILFLILFAARLVGTRREEYMRHYLQPPSQVSLLGLEKFSLEISIAEKKDVFLCRTNLDWWDFSSIS